MTSTGSVQDRIQSFINSHPDYQGKPLSEFSSELVAAGILTVEELGTLDSKSTFSIMQADDASDVGLDSFEHSDDDNAVVSSSDEKVIRSTDAETGEVRITTITYFNGQPSVKRVTTESGELVAEYSYSPVKLSNGKEAVAIVGVMAEGDRIEQTVVSDVDENGDYVDDAFLSRSTIVTKDTVLSNGISAAQGSRQTISIREGNLVDIITSEGMDKVVYTEYNGDSISEYDAQQLHRTYQEINEDGVIHSAEYENGNTRTVIRNNDGFERITRYFNREITRQGLDDSRHFTQAQLEALNPTEARRGLQVGQTILVPSEYNANAPILLNRGTAEEAVERYSNVAQQQAIKRLYTSTIEEQTLARNYTSYDDLARETLRTQGITNPTAEQLNDRANELIILNQKAPLTKGAKIRVVSNQSSGADVSALSSAGFKQTPENNAFFVKFNSLDSQQKQQVLSVLRSYSSIGDINKLKAIVFETTGVNLYDTSLTVNENKPGSMNANFYNASMPLEYFITNRLGLDLNSATGKEVYLRLRSLPQEQLNNIAASQFAPQSTNQYGMPNNKISVGSDATLKTVISAMAAQGVEMRTSDEIRMEESNPRFIARRKKEEAISFLYNSVNAAYSLINSHLDELKSHMFSNLGEIVLEDVKHYMIPDILKKMVGNNNGTVDGLMKSIFNKRDELRDTLMKISQLRTSSNFERDYKAITGCDYDPENVHPFLNHVENAQDFVQTSSFGGNIIEMAAMVYLTAGMGEIGFIKNSGAAVEAVTGSRALGMGTRGALTLGTYTAGRESLNLIDDFRNANSLSGLASAIENRGIQILEHSGQSALFGFVGGASAQKLFNLSKGAQNFVTNQFSKVFGKGGSVVLSDGAAATSAQVFTPSVEAISAADRVLANGAVLSSSELVSKVAASTQGLNWFGKATNLLLEVSTFAGLEITEQAAAGLAKEIFTYESELKHAIANGTLDEYLSEKIKNAPQDMWEHFKEQGINLIMLKAVSFAIGAHSGNTLKGQYETLDNSKIYKTVIDGQPKVVVETANGRMVCNSTSDALSFLHQAMTLEAMIKATPEKSETAPVDAEYTEVPSEYAELPVYARENLPENTTVMPSKNLIISTVTGEPVGRLAVKSAELPVHLRSGLTPEQSRLLLAKGISPVEVSDYFGAGLTRVAAARPETTVMEGSSSFKPTPRPESKAPAPREVFKIEEVLTESELGIKSSDIVRKVGENKFELSADGEALVTRMAEQINRVASEIEPEILRIMNSMGLDVGEKFSYRSKSVQSLHDKIQNALFENPDMTLEQALAEVKDAEGVRTLFELKDYSNHPEVQELLANGDREGAIRRAAELQSNETFEALKRYVDSVAEGTNEVEITRMSNYMGKDGIPYFSEAQLSALKAYADSKGVKLPIIERVTVKEEADGSRTETVNHKSTTKVRGSGYTALQMNFRLKNGFILEGQFRGTKVDNFAEAEHVPYDIRTGKDIIGARSELRRIYEPMIELLKGENKISDEMFDEHTAYLTAHYEYLRLVELGFEDGTNPPKFPEGLDARLRAENLELLHEYVEKIKKEPAREAELFAEYESKLVQNTPENTTNVRYNKVEPKLTTLEEVQQALSEQKNPDGTNRFNPNSLKFVSRTIKNDVQLGYDLLNMKNPDGSYRFEPFEMNEILKFVKADNETATALLNMKNPDGSYRFGTSDLSSVYESMKDNIQSGLDLLNMKNPDGSYRFGSYNLQTLLQLKTETPEIFDYVVNMKHSDGSFRFTPTSVESIVEFIKDDVELGKSILELRRPDGNYMFLDYETGLAKNAIKQFNDRDFALSLLKEHDNAGNQRFELINLSNLAFVQKTNPETFDKLLELYRTQTPDGEYKYSKEMVLRLIDAYESGNEEFEGLKARYDVISDYMRTNNLPIEYNVVRSFDVENGLIVTYQANDVRGKIIFDSENKVVSKRITENHEKGVEEVLDVNGRVSETGIIYDNFKKMLASIKEVRDKDGNLLYSEKYVESESVPGKYNIVRTGADGKEWVVGLAEYSQSGTLIIEKSLTGIDGSKTDYYYAEQPDGGRLSITKITDKEGNIISDNRQTFKVIDKNHFQSVENGVPYDIQFTGNKIVVTRGDSETVELPIDNSDSSIYIHENIVSLLKKLPGSALFNMSKFSLAEIGVGIHGVKSGNAHFSNAGNHISISHERSENNEVFILLHELGHMIDYKSANRIAENEELLDVFYTERQEFLANQSSMEAEAISYLTTASCGHGGIEEMIAETNAFLYANNKWGEIEQRGQYLQQYFPKTFAKIVELLQNATPADTPAVINPSEPAIVGAAPTGYSPKITARINDFLATSTSDEAKDYVTALRDNSIDESVIKDFLDMDDASKSIVLDNIDSIAENIAGSFANQSNETLSNDAAEKILFSLVLMKTHNPKSYDNLVQSKGFKAIKTGELNALLLQGIKATDTIGDNYFYELFEAKENDLDSVFSTNPKFKGYDSNIIKRIVDLDPAKQDEILDLLMNAPDEAIMTDILKLVSSRLTKAEQKRIADEQAGIFTRPDAIRGENDKLLDLIKLASEKPKETAIARKFRSSDDQLNTLIETLSSTKLPEDVKNQVIDLFTKAHTNFNSIRVNHVTEGIKFMEKFGDLTVLEKLLSVKQEKNIGTILKNISENNIELFKQMINSSSPITTEQLSMLGILKDYPEAKTFAGASPIMAAINDVMFDVEIGENGNYYTEAMNRKGLIEIKIKDPAKYARIEHSGLLDMVNSGQINSSILRQLNLNSDLSPEMYVDLAAVKNGESIVAEFREGTTLPYAFSKTNLGDVVEIGNKLYLNDGNGLVEWNMTKEKYLELFPPVLRFATQQGKVGNCYFVSSLANSMQNPMARLDVYKSFELRGDDVVVKIKDYEEYGGERVFGHGEITLDSKNAHLYGAKGLQMYEQTYARMALREEADDPTPALSDDTPSHTLMSRIRAGQMRTAMTEIHALRNYGMQEVVPADFTTGTIDINNITPAKLDRLLIEYFGRSNTMLGFGTKHKNNSATESTFLKEYNLVSQHGYSIIDYNPVTRMVTINNPHSSAVATEIPIDKLAKYMARLNITVLDNSSAGTSSSVRSRSASTRSAGEDDVPSVEDNVNRLSELRWESGAPIFDPEAIQDLAQSENVNNIIELAGITYTINGEERRPFLNEDMFSLAERDIESVKMLANLQIQGGRPRFTSGEIEYILDSGVDLFNVKKLAECVRNYNDAPLFNVYDIVKLAKSKNLFNIVKLAGIQSYKDGSSQSLDSNTLLECSERGLDFINNVQSLNQISYTNNSGYKNSRFTMYEIVELIDSGVDLNKALKVADIYWESSGNPAYSVKDIIEIANSENFDNVMRVAGLQRPNSDGDMSRFNVSDMLKFSKEDIDLRILPAANVKRTDSQGNVHQLTIDNIIDGLENAKEFAGADYAELAAVYLDNKIQRMETTDYYSELETPDGMRVFTGWKGRIERAETLRYMVELPEVSRSATAMKMATELVQNGVIDNHFLQYLPKEGELSPLIIDEINKFYEAYLNAIPFEDVLVPDVESLNNIPEDVTTGNVFRLKGEDKIYIKNSDGSATQLDMDKATYCKLFPAIERYSCTQNAIGNCWQITGFNALLQDSLEAVNVLSCIKQDGNDIVIRFPKGKSGDIRFENGQLPEYCRSQFYSEGALGLQLLEFAHAREMQKEMIDKTYQTFDKQMQEATTDEQRTVVAENRARFTQRLESYGDNLFIYNEGEGTGWDWGWHNYDVRINEYRDGGSSNQVWELLGYEDAKSIMFDETPPEELKAFINNPDTYKTHLMGWASDGVGERDVARTKGLVSGHAYRLSPNVDANNVITSFNILNPWGVLQTTLSPEEVLSMGKAIYTAKRK